ncbi:MAG: HAD family hydrolase, partial [Eubacteriales bacterium]
VSFPGGFLIYRGDSVILENLTTMRMSKFVTVKELDEFDGKNYFKAVIYSAPENREKIRDYLDEHFSEYFIFTCSSNVLTEMQPLGVSKAFQLKTLHDRIKAENPNAVLYCIGDYENDYDMLKMADIAVCPENASDRIKSISSIMTCHCKDGAVADLIDKIEASL